MSPVSELEKNAEKIISIVSRVNRVPVDMSFNTYSPYGYKQLLLEGDKCLVKI